MTDYTFAPALAAAGVPEEASRRYSENPTLEVERGAGLAPST